MNPEPTQLSSGQLAQVACILEATARKPGNVHRFRDFDDTTYLDFLLSASAIAGPLDRAVGMSLGQTILSCVEATRRVVATNTNLGMILLLAPLATVPMEEEIRAGLNRVLGSTTRADAELVYQAIRLAQPGGLGQVEDQDVEAEPTITLVETMRLAADRDLVARQYANGFADVFDAVVPLLKSSINGGMRLESAIINAFLGFLSENPDTLIIRKRGLEFAAKVSSRAREVYESDWAIGGDEGIESLAKLDDWLRADGHARNPGATADLTTAGLFVALRDGTIQRPMSRAWSNSGGSNAPASYIH